MSDILDPNLYDRLGRVEQTVEKLGDRFANVENEFAGVRSEVHSMHDGLTEVKAGLADVNHQLIKFAGQLGEHQGRWAGVQQWAPTLAVLVITLGFGGLLERRINALEVSVSSRISTLESRITVVEGPGFKLALPVDPTFHAKVSDSEKRMRAVRFVLPPDGPKEVSVKAMAPGTVTEMSQSKGDDGKMFWTVAITPETGLTSHYSHLTESHIALGQRVTAGQEIGIMRKGSPICLQVWVTKLGSDEAIDPRPYFPK